MASGRNKRNSRLTSSTEVLQSLLKNGKSPLGQSFTRWKLWKDWDKIVGQEISNNSKPLHYHQGVLYLWVKSSTRMQEMSFLTKEIRNKVNEYTGHRWVQRVRLTLNKEMIENPQEMKQSLNKIFSKK